MDAFSPRRSSVDPLRTYPLVLAWASAGAALLVQLSIPPLGAPAFALVAALGLAWVARRRPRALWPSAAALVPTAVWVGVGCFMSIPDVLEAWPSGTAPSPRDVVVAAVLSTACALLAARLGVRLERRWWAPSVIAGALGVLAVLLAMVLSVVGIKWKKPDPELAAYLDSLPEVARVLEEGVGAACRGARMDQIPGVPVSADAEPPCVTWSGSLPWIVRADERAGLRVLDATEDGRRVALALDAATGRVVPLTTRRVGRQLGPPRPWRWLGLFGLFFGVLSLSASAITWRALRRASKARAGTVDDTGRIELVDGKDGRTLDHAEPGDVIAWRVGRRGLAGYREDAVGVRWEVVAGDRMQYVEAYRRRAMAFHAIGVVVVVASLAPLLAARAHGLLW